VNGLTTKAATKTNVDVMGFFANAILMTGRFVLRNAPSNNIRDNAKTIMLIWKRTNMCVETIERGNDHKTKEYPKLISKIKQGHNMLYKYRIPTGLSFDKLSQSIAVIEFDLKSEVLVKILENEKKAHFSLRVLSGKLLDLINYTNEAEISPESKSLKKGLWIPIGWSRRGLEQLDLASSNSPHLMIGGATGGGKSILGRLIMVCLHLRYTSDDCRLWLCDLKHGNGTSMLGDDPLLVDRTISNPEDVYSLMQDASDEIGKRYALFRKYKCDDLEAFNEAHPKNRLPRIVIYVDEMTKLEGKEFKATRELMTKVTGESRGAGIHMIISCHRPTANLVSGTMKNNFSAVVAFRCNATSARVLLGEDKSEYESALAIDPDVEGRALFKFKDEVLVQVPYINNKMVREIMEDYQKPPDPYTPMGNEIIRGETAIVLSTRNSNSNIQ